PERCPKCGMLMVPNAECGPACGMHPEEGRVTPASTGTTAGSDAGRRVLFYRSPMDPRVTSPVPAKDAMGMDYVPVTADEAEAASGVPGLAPVELGPAALELARVQTAEAREEAI